MATPVNVNDAYTDFSSLNTIKQLGRKDSAAGLKQVAQQFEALFVNMMLKTMRDSNKVFAEGNILQSNEMDFYQQNFDNQISLHLSQGKGLGLAEVLHRQLLQQYKVNEGGRSEQAQSGRDAAESEFKSPLDFLNAIYPSARKAASKLGLKTEVLLAQSALETGWGTSLAKDSGGKSSHNLFGIKADSQWQGSVSTSKTLEFSDGVAKQQTAKFRHYDSFQDSFEDYVNFLEGNPRYSKALRVASDDESFVAELQAAGYATDPHYGQKITTVMNSRTMRDAIAVIETAGGD